jgi:phosphoribosylaminoimidazolecarboxamide formyltransferase/IMP cyclohydrolase
VTGTNKKAHSALISVYSKDGLSPLLEKLSQLGIRLYSTGGTQTYIEQLGYQVTPVETLTSYPSILGGRVKTLHPKIFGGILNRRGHEGDAIELEEYQIPEIDMVIVDLYPFEDTLASTSDENEIIEKIDIGGISLIRAAAKNYRDVIVVASKNEYSFLLELLAEKNGESSIEDRKWLAGRAFDISSHYDSIIYKYFAGTGTSSLKLSVQQQKVLRYGENPHQKGVFHGNLDGLLKQLHGKDLSYNNLLDIDAAISLIADFTETTMAILKHNNACGIASKGSTELSWKAALEADPISAFGGVVISNALIDESTAKEIDKIFFEIIIAPAFSDEALKILKQKKNRMILLQIANAVSLKQIRTVLNGVLEQDRDASVEGKENMKIVTQKKPSAEEFEDLEFANIVVKHTKSNAIVLAKNKQLLASGTGQTSRVDALKQAIEKAQRFGFSLEGAVMASDAFFPFPDCVEIANKAGINAIIQPGGSIKDQDSIDYCDKNGISMAITGIRHFKH